MMYYYDCPVCGQKVSKALNACPNCGCPTSDMMQKEESQQVAAPQQAVSSRPNPVYTPKKKSKAPIIAVIAVLLVAVGVAAYFLFIKKDDSKKDGKATDQVVEQNTQASEQASGDVIKEFKENYSSTVSKMCSGALQAEEFGHFYYNVWYNSIYKEESEETDKYTKDENGEFYDDFNDALNQIYADEDCYQKMKAIGDNQVEVQDLMKKLINPPEECKESYEAIKEMYDHYIEFTNLVTHPEGHSLQTYLEDFNDTDTATANSLDKVELYID